MDSYNIQNLLLLKREISDLKAANAPLSVIDLRETQLKDGTKKAIVFYQAKMNNTQMFLSHDKLIAKWTLPRLSKDDWESLITLVEESERWEMVKFRATTCQKCGHHYVFQCTCN